MGLPGKLGRTVRTYKLFRTIIKGTEAWERSKFPEWLGKELSAKMVKGPVNKGLAKLVRAPIASRPATANNLFAGRTKKLQLTKGWAKMVVVYHEANKAGRHVDIHIGSISIVKRLRPEFVIGYGKDGKLNQASKDRIMELVKAEFKGNAWLAQNLDHSPKDAEYQWFGEGNGPRGYGAGPIREVVSSEPIYMSPGESSVEISAPHISNDHRLYLFKIMDRNNVRDVPIVSMGLKRPPEPVLRDRLHLLFDKDPDKFKRMVGKRGDIRYKYDGASTYIESGPKGTRLWSPRISKRTGRRIEYTSKVPGIESLKTKTKMVAMGELLFKREGQYLSASETGGVLNAGRLDPGLKPEIRAYRCDRFNGKSTGDLTQPKNHALLGLIIPKSKGLIKLPERVSWFNLDRTRDAEGVVGVPHGATLNEGRKLKWRGDEQDWKVESVDLSPGNKGGVAGVVWFKSLESGKRFKLGGGPLGPESQRRSMMTSPNEYIGKVMKVRGLNGHEGRAAKFSSWHLDK